MTDHSAALTLLFLVAAAVPAAAQPEPAVVLSAGTHAMTLPWHTGPLTVGFNPALMAGTDRPISSGDQWSFFYAINVGFIRHRWWMTGVSVEPELGVGRRLPGGFHAGVRIGLGYMHYFWRRRTLELDEDAYVEAKDWGRPSLIVPLSATLGYRGAADAPLTVSPFVSARWGVQALFLEEIPVLTHLSVQGGVRIRRGPDATRDGR